MIKRLVLFCARLDAHAGVVLDILTELQKYDIAGFFDDDTAVKEKKYIKDIPVLGGIESFHRNLPSDVEYCFICTGNNSFRAYCYNMASNCGLKPVNIIHPSAVISKTVQIGNGVFIGANVSITNNVKIGNGVIINTASVIEHDNIIENFVNISPNSTTSGRVTIKEGAFLGSAATVIPDISIGKNAYVAAGSVVTKDIPPGVKVGGVPARPLK